MDDSSKKPSRDGQSRVRPKMYGFALYLVAGILLLQVVFCLSVFFLRPYVIAKTPEGILQSEREKAGEWMGNLTRFLQSRMQLGLPWPGDKKSATNAPVKSP
ncbi:MAG: hypothetical protein NTU87_02670 [Verrucomicrobia bacterium]|nr:hypothetical protein [Verrucomicrobiota bacterium]